MFFWSNGGGGISHQNSLSITLAKRGQNRYKIATSCASRKDHLHDQVSNAYAKQQDYHKL